MKMQCIVTLRSEHLAHCDCSTSEALDKAPLWILVSSSLKWDNYKALLHSIVLSTQDILEVKAFV
jgi:hypothetical protein